MMISLPMVESLLGSNVTLTKCVIAPRELRYFTLLNSICKELHAGTLNSFYHQFKFNQPTMNISEKHHRNSVPRIPDMKESEMRNYVQQLINESEPWKSIKMVVLGNGRIGKTTLLRAFDKLLSSSSSTQVQHSPLYFL